MYDPTMATTLRSAYNAERTITTNGHRPPRTPVLVILGRFMGKHLPTWSAVRTAVLVIAAFVCAVVAAWGVDYRLGLLVACPGLLVLEALSGETARR